MVKRMVKRTIRGVITTTNILTVLFFFFAILFANALVAQELKQDIKPDLKQELGGPIMIPERPKERSAFRFEIPIAWQVTQASFLSPGSLMQTESFREVWTVEVHLDGRTFLSTPRAKVAVLRPLPEKFDGSKPPSSVVLTQRDLVKLLGMMKRLEKAENIDDPKDKSQSDSQNGLKENAPSSLQNNPKLDQFISFQLSPPGGGGVITGNFTGVAGVTGATSAGDLVLTLSEDEYFSIKIEFDSTKI